MTAPPAPPGGAPADPGADRSEAAAPSVAAAGGSEGSAAAGGSGGSAAAGGDAASDAAAVKLTGTLRARLGARETGDFWIRLADTADLSAARGLRDWEERGRYVHDALRATAEASQAGVVAELRRAGVAFEPHWISNAIHVTGGSLDLAEELAADPAVARVHEPVAVAPVDPVEPRAAAGRGGGGVEWGVAAIHAPEVWERGHTGEGITVATVDSGVDGEHPALAARYRGLLADGRVDHDYHWFDVSGACRGAPCDPAGHGTHVMGTVLGDDGAGNRTGVAPGARWITVNGCDVCSDADLLTAAEWILAPTRADGSEPNPAMRPHVVNNSWGSQLAGDINGFYGDQVAAWEAAGIFAVWAAGNTGEAGCRSTSSPGGNAATYAVGATTSTGQIATFSARGPGEDGVVQPNLTAPGEDVRSSVPGGGYELSSGTSMAAPHVTGAVALLWSAVPSLIGDVGATRDLLDTSAVDHASDECGGSAERNNVFGEGDLDALALVEAAGAERSGTLAGRVTAGGEPVDGATVTVGDRSTGTGVDGRFAVLLPAGPYEVAVEAYGYRRDVAPRVVVPDGGTTAHDVALDLAPTRTVRGTVTDGSGHGWPLGASVAVDGAPPGTSTWSDPFTGEYALEVPVGGTRTVVVTPEADGYRTVRDDVVVGPDAGAGALAHDVAVPVTPACVAPGYAFGGGGVPLEEFASGATPRGWTVEDRAGTGQTWTFDDAFAQGNETAGDGLFAEVNSDGFGPDGHQDTTLTTPALDFTGDADPVLRFSQSFEALGGEFADVDLSVDGGATWRTVLHQTLPASGPVVVPLAAAADRDEVRVRFHYGNARWAFWWQIDDVGFGDCDPVEGGLVAGHVTDRNTGDGVVGAVVSEAGAAAPGAESVDPGNPHAPAGYYTLFLAAGTRTLVVERDGYVPDRSAVDVVADALTRHDVALRAPRLAVSPQQVSGRPGLGDTGTGAFTVTNEGTASAQVEVSAGSSDAEILSGGTAAGVIRGASGPATVIPVPPAGERAGGASGEASGRGEAAPGPPPAGVLTRHGDGQPGTAVLPAPPAALRSGEGLTLTHSSSQEIRPDASASCVGQATQVLRTFTLDDFDVGGDFAVTHVSFGVELAEGPTDVTVTLYTLDGDLRYAGLTPLGSATSTLGAQELTLVDVPVEGTAPAGSTLVVEIAVPDGPVFFVGSNAEEETAPTYIASEACGDPEPTPTADAGFPDMHVVMNVTGTTEVDVPWLDVQPPAFSLEPGESATVRVGMDAGRVDQPGRYEAEIVVAGAEPYPAPRAVVAMSVTPPHTWGKIAGTVRGTACDGTSGPLDGAFVAIDGTEYDVTLVTGADGGYARWMGVSNNRLEVLSSADGYPPVSTDAWIIAGRTVVQDVELTRPCG